MHRVTADASHPVPWRWWFTVDTLYGNCTQEGLSATTEEAAKDATSFLQRWLRDSQTARETKIEIEIEVEEPEDE